MDSPKPAQATQPDDAACAAALTADTRPSPEFLAAIPYDFAVRHAIVSIGRDDDDTELIIHAETTPPAAIHNTRVRLATATQFKVADAETIRTLIEAHYESANAEDASEASEAGCSDQDVELETLIGRAESDLLSTTGKAPIVQLTDALLFDAIQRGASDIHVQMTSDIAVVRYRIDGELLEARRIPGSVASSVVTRIKVIGGMDVADQRLPQDGRATVHIGSGRSIDLRISTIPTCYGERAVLRLLDAGSASDLAELSDLGMPEDIADRFLACIAEPFGMTLLTGPTGSGKTTTLYATLRWCADTGRSGQNIMTIEDPIEYRIPGYGALISQSQVNRKKGITFASGLRHLLRQDPDVIMVGEIRDAETAKLAVQASLTGHLVLSTLHTNDSVSAIPRLFDLGVEPYLVSSSLRAVLAQRLLRRVHAACHGRGCDDCLGTGLRGRLGVFELFALDAAARRLVGSRADSEELDRAAHRTGMRRLREEGQALSEAGLTTALEGERVRRASFAHGSERTP